MHHLQALLVLLVSLCAAAGYGWVWLRLLRRRSEPLRLLYALALGLGTLAYLVLFIGLAGHLSRATLAVLLVGGGVLAAFYLAEVVRGRGTSNGLRLRLGLRTERRTPNAEDEDEDEDERRTPDAGRRTPNAVPHPITQPPNHSITARAASLALCGYLGLLLLATLLSALKPVDTGDWDSLSYHLAAPKIYLREGRISFIAYDPHTHFPFTMEMLYTLGLAFGGAGGAKLFHWAAGWLTAAALGVWTSRLEVRGQLLPEWAGPFAAAAFASMPLALWEMGTAYVDLGTALFQFLALAALVDALFRPATSTLTPAVDRGGAALAGALSGFALGTKYTALLQFGLLGLGLLWLLARAGKGARPAVFQAALAFGVLGVVVASPWYLKNWFWVHNPVYPFFYRLFPHSYSWNSVATAGYDQEQGQFGLGRGPQSLFRSFWDLAVHGRAFYVKAPKTLVGDKLGSLGPLWAGLLPLALWARGLGRPVLACLLYGLGSIGLWFLMTHQARYLMPVFASLAVVVTVVLATLESRALRLAAATFAALSLVGNVWMHKEVVQPALLVVTGAISEDEFLRRMVGPPYEAARFADTLLEDSRIAFYQETRGFYFDRSYFWANPGQHDLIPYGRIRTGEELAAELKRFGITHVLINFQFTLKEDHQSSWYPPLAAGIRSGVFEEVYRTRGAAAPWELPDPAQPSSGAIVYRIR